MKYPFKKWIVYAHSIVFWGMGWVFFGGRVVELAGATIVQSNEKQVIFEYKPKVIEKPNMLSTGNEMSILKLEDAGKILIRNGYLLPSKSFWVGIPPHTKPVVQILSLKIEQRENVLPEKADLPEQGGADFGVSKSAKSSVPVESVESNVYFPASFVHIAEEGWLRNLKIARIEINPIRMNFSQHRAKILSSIRIAVQFLPQGSESVQRKVIPSPFAQIGKSLLLNGTLSQNWGMKHLVLDKKAEPDSFSLWFKIPVAREGFFKIDRFLLQKIGLDIRRVKVDALHLFYGGRDVLPWDVKASTPELREVATYFKDANGDGLFEGDDALIFYAQSLDGWSFSSVDKRFRHSIHPYARQNVYWLAIGGSHRKQMAQIRTNWVSAETTRTAWRYFYREREKLNPEKSGIQWYWKQFSGNATQKFSLSLKNVVAQDSFDYRIRMVGASFDHHDLEILLNGNELEHVDLPYERPLIFSGGGKGGLKEGENELTIRQTSTVGPTDKSFLDWIELHYRTNLKADSTGLVFYAPLKNQNLTFVLTGFQGNAVTVFNVSDPWNVRYGKASQAPGHPGEWFFTDQVLANFQKKYIAICPNQILPVEEIHRAANPLGGLRRSQNRADYLIITHRSLLGSDLSRLAAHRADCRYWPNCEEPPTVKIVTVDQIYDAFSWGVPDPTAIRNFLKYTLEHWSRPPQYVLLVGNACYDMKRNSGASPITLVPTHEDELRATDDWFAFLTPDRIMDMILGRLSVQNKKELHALVEKILAYDDRHAEGPWQARVLLVADDANSPAYKSSDIVFGRDTEVLAKDSVLSDLDLQKVYLDAYMPDALGKKEGAKRDFLKKWNRGNVLVNFLGHANLEVLTHESIFYTPQDLSLIQNGERYPLFFAATCAVGQFDYDRKPCMAEYLTNLENRGAIATIGSTRWTWHELNYVVNHAFIEAVFQPANRGRLSIGEALLAAKLQSRYADHRELITLFGDPALRLALPAPKLRLKVSPDSLSLHRRTQVQVSIQGKWENRKNPPGKVYIELRDSGKMYHPQGYQYYLPGEVVYQDTLEITGKNVVKNFFPKTIALNGGNLGQLFGYAWGNQFQASARLDSITIKKDLLHSFSEIDSTGPNIRVLINGREVEKQSDLAVFPNFNCQITLQDSESGILTSSSEAYPITLFLESDTSQMEWNLASKLAFMDSSRKKAVAEIPFKDLLCGSYTFKVSAWDQSLNPSIFQWKARVEPPRLTLTRIMNYPNPATKRTYFTFDSSNAAWITIKIYTISGRLIKTLTSEVEPGFNKIPEEGWNCRDADGDRLANGVYLYKIEARPEYSEFQAKTEGQTTSALGRLIILR